MSFSKKIPDQSILDTFNKQTYLGNQWIIPTSGSLSTTSETVLILIKNMSAAGTANPTSLFINLRKCASSAAVTFRYYYSSSITATGSASASINLIHNSPTTPNGVCYLSPTISANGALITAIAANSYVDVSSSMMIVVEPGNSFLVTAQPAAVTATSYLSEVAWYELTYGV